METQQVLFRTHEIAGLIPPSRVREESPSRAMDSTFATQGSSSRRAATLFVAVRRSATTLIESPRSFETAGACDDPIFAGLTRIHPEHA